MITLNNLRQWAFSIGITALALGSPVGAMADNANGADNIYGELPFQMDKVQLPVFPDYSRSITEFGAVADGITLNTEAFDNSILPVLYQPVRHKQRTNPNVPAEQYVFEKNPVYSHPNLSPVYTEYQTSAHVPATTEKPLFHKR